MIIWPGAMNLMFGCGLHVSAKIYDYLARGHEFNVWLLIACVSEKFMSILAWGHELIVWLLIACVRENI